MKVYLLCISGLFIGSHVVAVYQEKEKALDAAKSLAHKACDDFYKYSMLEAKLYYVKEILEEDCYAVINYDPTCDTFDDPKSLKHVYNVNVIEENVIN